MEIEGANLFISLIVVIVTFANAWISLQNQLAIAQLKVYMHEKFVTKETNGE